MTYSVLDVLGDHPEAVEADLAHHYHGYGPGGPLTAFWQGRISLRWLRVMVEGLPPDGAAARAQAGHHWTQRDWAAADHTDLLQQILTVLINANRGEDQPAAPWPEPVWRPGDPVPEEKAAADTTRRVEAREAFERINRMVLPPTKPSPPEGG
ncbi:hypothetical protein [Streptomyces sp. NRRL F-5135]|uniref:hypothetical protein n=1 Tax=Streptomyces sp. NRRL F-5135 TaxID=1463858 RepID=UPI00099C9ED5|nr:hypothetical protein [Streptomyces sp. NRRL F-5135]